MPNLRACKQKIVTRENGNIASACAIGDRKPIAMTDLGIGQRHASRGQDDIPDLGSYRDIPAVVATRQRAAIANLSIAVAHVATRKANVTLRRRDRNVTAMVATR